MNENLAKELGDLQDDYERHKRDTEQKFTSLEEAIVGLRRAVNTLESAIESLSESTAMEVVSEEAEVTESGT